MLRSGAARPRTARLGDRRRRPHCGDRAGDRGNSAGAKVIDLARQAGRAGAGRRPPASRQVAHAARSRPIRSLDARRRIRRLSRLRRNRHARGHHRACRAHARHLSCRTERLRSAAHTNIESRDAAARPRGDDRAARTLPRPATLAGGGASDQRCSAHPRRIAANGSTRAIAAGADVIGGVPQYADEPLAFLDLLFAFAERSGLPSDMHIDEHLDQPHVCCSMPSSSVRAHTACRAGSQRVIAAR